MGKSIIIQNNFAKSLIWIILPLCIYGSISSCSSYIEAGTHLTPYSVSVRGYYRNDGTYVRAYSRRPPGSVSHDAPYEDKSSLMGFLFALCIVVGTGNIVYFYTRTEVEIKSFEQSIRNAENKKKAEEKESQKKQILKKLNLHFIYYDIWPQYLFVGNSLIRCKICHRNLNRNEFYIAYKAIKYLNYACIPCTLKNNTIGRGQPSSKYVNELKFVETFLNKFEQFKKDFHMANQSSFIEFSAAELEEIYLKEVKINCNRF
jgi:hypothetical protein